MGLTPGPVYYRWPSWLAVPEASAAAAIGDLAGARICVVSHSAGVDWLAGELDGLAPAPRALPPVDPTIVARASDAECQIALDRGEADAAVTAALLDDELAARGLRSVTADAAFVERRTVVLRGSGADVAGLQTLINDEIDALAASGQLLKLSRGAFGGRDLTEDPR